jgi:hypothetical protein
MERRVWIGLGGTWRVAQVRERGGERDLHGKRARRHLEVELGQRQGALVVVRRAGRGARAAGVGVGVAVQRHLRRRIQGGGV